MGRARAEIDASTRVRRVPSLKAVERGGALVMLSLHRGRYFRLDGVGASIWPLLAVPRTVSEICTCLRSEYDVTAESVEVDVLDFLRQLIDVGLAEVVGDR